MDFRLKGFLAAMLASLAVFSWLIYYSTTGDRLKPIPADAKQGKRIFQQKACVECHTVFGNGGYSGGDLTKIYGKFGSEGLKDYLTHPPVISGAKQRRHEHLTKEEADGIIAYFDFINLINTIEWPPRPMPDDKIR
jgi:nitric oxide reductase subunit C